LGCGAAFALIVYGIGVHSKGVLAMIPSTLAETHQLAQSMGWIPVIALMLHAYSLGSGTYTGLEAVSNNVNRLAEPRVRTGKWTMLYMAVSLQLYCGRYYPVISFMGCASHVRSDTQCRGISFYSGEQRDGSCVAHFDLALEAGYCLLPPIQDFLPGPLCLRIWLSIVGCPIGSTSFQSARHTKRCDHVWCRSTLILLWSQGRVAWLVILYSINVFITFSLSLLGLCVYWARERSAASANWKWRLSFSFFAFFIAACILAVTLSSKFTSGGWVTVAITCTVIALCLIIKGHYNNIAKKLAEADIQLNNLSLKKYTSLKHWILSNRLPLFC